MAHIKQKQKRKYIRIYFVHFLRQLGVFVDLQKSTDTVMFFVMFGIKRNHTFILIVKVIFCDTNKLLEPKIMFILVYFVLGIFCK